MSRMRLAIRSGWNISKSSRFSPVDANMTGLPVTDATESAAPPRASPSSLERTTPVKLTPSLNACAVLTASWPIIASMTKRTSSGLMAARMSAACCIISASTPSRPAVSTMTTSYSLCRASAMPSRATATGSPVAESNSDCAPGCGAKTGTPARSAVDLELGHGVGALQVGGDQQRAVALALEPLGQLARQRGLTGALQAGEHDHRRRVLGQLMRRVSPPRMLTSSSLTILTTCWPGFSASRDLLAEGAFLHVGGELAHHGHGDVGVEQGTPDLAHGGIDVGLGQASLAAQVLEG